MNAYKKPTEIASLFGCSVEQARHQLEKNLAQMTSMLEYMREKKMRRYRGFTEVKLAERVQSLNVALDA